MSADAVPIDIAAQRAAKAREEAKEKYAADVTRLTTAMVDTLFPGHGAAWILEKSAVLLHTIGDTLDAAAEALK